MRLKPTGESMEHAITLLLVDDEEDVTQLLSRRLSKRGYACRCANDGEGALTCLCEQPVQIIVMDVKMPGMGGMAALQRIKADWPDIPVILLSGHADMQTAVSAMQTGAFGYLMKPVDFEELLFKIEDATAQLQLEGKV